MVKYRCNRCGREFPNKTPHKCLTGFQKRHLTYTRVYEGKSLFEEADNNPKSLWRSVEDDLPCNHEELTHSNYTDRVLISARNGFAEVAFMSIIEDAWEWATPIKVSHWMSILKLPEQIKD